MPKMKLGSLINEVKIKVEDPKSSYEFFIAGDHMDTEDIHIRRRGVFAETAYVGPAFIRLFRPGQILYGSRRTYLKKVAVADFEGITSNTTFVLETRNESVLAQSLLPFILLSDDFTAYSIKKSKGSTNPYILFSDICDYELNLPSIEKQRELASTLLAIDAAIESYKTLLDKCDELIKSRFVEMFGTFDEPLNADDLHPLSAVLFDVTKGPFGSDMKKSLYVPRSERTYKAYIQLNAIEKNAALGEYFISEAYFEEKMFKYEVKPGDYIVTCDGTLGKIFRLPAEIERGVISSSLMRIRLNEESISPQYFESLWDFDILPRLKAQVRNGCLVHLPSAKVLLNTRCILPPISLQKEFGDFVAAIDKLKFGFWINNRFRRNGKLYQKRHCL